MPPESVAPPSDGFTLGRRGYDPQQVDAHLRRLDAEVRILVADRDAAVDQAAQLGRELDEARLRAERLRTQVRTMAGRPSDVQGMSERMRTMLRLAEDEVADMLRRADVEVARRLQEADLKAEEVLGSARQDAARTLESARTEAEAGAAETSRLRTESDAACAADRQSLADERAAAAQELARADADAERERSRLWAESEARRALVEEDFAIAMDQRRSEALADVRAERARTVEWVRQSQEETTRMCRAELAAAQESARRIIAEAEQRVAEMADLRGRMAAQLHGTQEQLRDALAALMPGAEPPAAGVAAPPTRTATPVEPRPAAALPAPPPAPELAPAMPVPAPPGDDTVGHRPAAVADEPGAVPDPEPHAPAASAPEERPAPDAEPATRPLPATPADTLVMDAPASAPDAPAVPSPRPTDAEQQADATTPPQGQPRVDDPRPVHARRRRRRPATGATRR